MNLRKIVLVACILVLAVGCSHRKKGGFGIGNIPTAEGGEGGPLRDIHFAFDSYVINDESKSILEGNAAWLKEHRDVKVQIEGHCDERGTNEYNMVLGENRARAVFDYMRSLGIAEDRMKTISYGEEIPLDPGHNEEAWAKNRRAHFRIME